VWYFGILALKTDKDIGSVRCSEVNYSTFKSVTTTKKFGPIAILSLLTSKALYTVVIESKKKYTY
jgi:hypothetical protein